MCTYEKAAAARRERCASRGYVEDDPEEVMALRVLRDMVVRVSVEMTVVGRMAKSLSVGLREDRFTARPCDGPARTAALRQAAIFAQAALAASGYGAPPLTVPEDDPVVFHQMLRTTTMLDAAIAEMGGEV